MKPGAGICKGRYRFRFRVEGQWLSIGLCCAVLQDSVGRTPLHYAASWGFADCINAVLGCAKAGLCQLSARTPCLVVAPPVGPSACSTVTTIYHDGQNSVHLAKK